MATADLAAPLPPVYVDLDGTLIRGDLLADAAAQVLKGQPGAAWRLGFWLLGGRARFKTEVAARTQAAPESLTYHEELLRVLKTYAAEGRRLVLATGAPAAHAQAVAKHLGLFSSVLATGPEENLVGAAKARRIEQDNGGQPFWYVGNSAADLPIWRRAAAGIVVGPSPGLERLARAATAVTLVLPAPGAEHQAAPTHRRLLTVLPAALRVHQWVKNLLVFVPLATAHALTNAAQVAGAAAGFVAFSACASAIYLINDLLDAADDRRHPVKRHRPIAAGTLGAGEALAVAATLLALGLGGGWWLTAGFGAALSAYVVLTLAYSLVIKKIALADVLLLAGLYTLRIVAGGLAAGITISSWLLAFSVFFFLSLAYAKRFAEVRALAGSGSVPGRGYREGDLAALGTMGTGSAYAAALIYALYIHSGQVQGLYHHKEWLWGICPIILYWSSRLWLLAHRGELHTDPVVFALRDRTSYVLGLVAALFAYLAL